jgi:hypothetical protein
MNQIKPNLAGMVPGWVPFKIVSIQGPFHQSLVAIGPVVSEEKIKMWNVDGRTTDDGRKVMTIAHMA